MANTAAVEPARRSTRVKRPAPKAIESDDEPAPAKPVAKKAKAPPAAKKAAKKAKKAPAPPVALPKQSALVRILSHEHELLREVASYCAYRDVAPLCSYSYAKDRYLITDKDLKGVAVLKVDDETKAHGLMMTKMSVVLVADALKAAVAKHGSEDTLEAKRAIRKATAQLKHDAKLVEYTTSLKAWQAQPVGTKSMDDYPKYPKSPSSSGKWNFLARNQRCWDMLKVCDKYGLWEGVPPPALKPTKRAKVYVVTDSTPPHEKAFAARHLRRLLINTLSLNTTIKVVGTPNGSIVSNNVALWVSARDVFVDLEGLRVRVDPDGGEDWSPCVVFGGGHVRAVDCVFESGPRAGLRDIPEEPTVRIKENNIVTDCVHLGLGGYFIANEPDDDDDEGQAKLAAIRKKIERENAVLAHTDDPDYSGIMERVRGD
ncbi:hypothetical protein JL720_15501 [Aureococcus anophagefferens]|nr:hypothetical protein JL720_15501 [Aureococcus anophagefferens]